ncbi:MAG: PDZ domain-containing protein [Candidatus Brocadiia bacterium]
MKSRFSLACALVAVLAFTCYAWSEDVVAPQGAKLSPKQLLEKFAPYLMSCTTGGNGAMQVQIVIQGGNGNMMRASGGASAMALLISDDVAMYPREDMFGNWGIVVNGGQQGPEVKVFTLPNGKEAEGESLGFHRETNVDFAQVKLPEGHGVQKIDWTKTETVALGDNVYIIGRRGKEWKFAPFFLPAMINGELEKDGMKLFSCTLPQGQLSGEAKGALVVREDGTILGLINSVEGREYGCVVAPLEYFAKAMEVAINNPKDLEQPEPPQQNIMIPGFVPGQNPDDAPPDPPQVFLGVTVKPVDKETADKLGIKEGTGLVVTEVGDGTPAGVAGIVVGDVMLTVGGQPVANIDELFGILKQHVPGDVIEIVLWREGKEAPVTVTLGNRGN